MREIDTNAKVTARSHREVYPRVGAPPVARASAPPCGTSSAIRQTVEVTSTQEATNSPSPSSARDWLRRGLILVAVLGAIGLFVLAGRSADTKPTNGGAGGIVQALVPGEGDNALQQTPISVDLAPGWGLQSLRVDGVDVPRRDWKVTNQLNLYQFSAGKGKSITKLNGNTNCVDAVVYSFANPSDTRPVHWCFTVA